VNAPDVKRDIQARLNQIAENDPHLRTFIRVDAQDALNMAAASDRRFSDSAALSPLDGVATAVKDNLAFRGKPWTAGIEGRRDLIATSNSSAVARLGEAGAVLIGGANMEEAALGAVTDNPFFGRCINPLGEGLTPGGSSGGSAAAVAAGFVDLAIGTDTMGSVRVPAAYCGIAGIKPTAGSIDNSGLAMLCPALDTIGPMARDVALLWQALQVLGNEQALRAWEARTEVPDLTGVRFGLPAQIDQVDCEPAILEGLRVAEDAINRLGGSVETIDLADWDPHVSRRAGLLVVEAAAAGLMADLIESPGAISDHLRSLLVYGRDAPAAKISAAEAEILRVGEAFAGAFSAVEAILLPTTPQRAFPHGVRAPANQADLTAPANFSGCPAVALPVQVTADDLPPSVQLMGPLWSDPVLLGWAELLAPALTERPDA
jgi:aspartyl-tRNA(Asn)/glutamyl-tRNA(Gln) amidotransferase subunit A